MLLICDNSVSMLVGVFSGIFMFMELKFMVIGSYYFLLKYYAYCYTVFNFRINAPFW